MADALSFERLAAIPGEAQGFYVKLAATMEQLAAYRSIEVSRHTHTVADGLLRGAVAAADRWKGGMFVEKVSV